MTVKKCFKNVSVFIYILCLFAGGINAQEKYWVFYTDKEGVTFDPLSYFDAKAIERRMMHKLPLYDFTDMPVSESYIQKTANITDSILQVSRWFNAVAVWADSNAVAKLSKLCFVDSLKPIASRAFLAQSDNYEPSLTADEKSLLEMQIKHMQGELFIENGITGKGVRIAVFDAGFPNVDTHEAFEHLKAHNRIIKTWNFVSNRPNVYRNHSHGTSVLSCIAGIHQGQNMGLATDAEFLLARTEMAYREPFSEEENWLAAVEWADKNGAHIINSSLGYIYHRYFPEDMDGGTSLVARAANMAAAKGILVVNAAGNEGSSDWKFIGTPADADSVLSIGGINPDTGFKIGFSSLGPTADKRMKPNVSAYAKTLVAKRIETGISFGTSFASPLVAGFAACALQTNPQMTNMELFEAIQKSASLYPYFDYAHGYGVPQAGYFFENVARHVKQTFAFEVKNNELVITVNEFNTRDDEEKKGCKPPGEYTLENYLYYNIQNADGSLHKYFLINVESFEPVRISMNDLVKGQTINAIYNGYKNSLLIK